MANEYNRVPAGPGRLLGGLSLTCFAVTLVVALVAAVLSDDARHPPRDDARP